jgi:hypothetical protein
MQLSKHGTRLPRPSSTEVLAQRLLLVGSVGREPSWICQVTFQEVWDIDLELVLFAGSVRKQVCTLLDLSTETEDIVDENQCCRC